jgi:putative tryptophan/tyrosine transport system substrate-binding protein
MNMARRRLALTALALAAGTSLHVPHAWAQPNPRIRRIAFINLGPPEPMVPNVVAFRQGLRDLGYVEGRDVVIEYFWADNRIDRVPSLVNEMLATRPDVILCSGGSPTIRAVKQATSSVPVVFITGDPTGENIVQSLARPGGNLTGMATQNLSPIDGKRVQLLRDVLPNAKTVAVLWNPETLGAIRARDATALAASGVGMAIDWYMARNDPEIDAALVSIAVRRPDALLLIADPVIGFRRKQIVEFAKAKGIPGMYFWPEFVEAGGLISYSPILTDMFRQSATYVDKILRGAKPADLPIEMPTTYKLVVNLSTAKALGIVFPKSVLVAAEVVQ